MKKSEMSSLIQRTFRKEKKFDYEISELRKQQRSLEQLVWDMKMKSKENYVLIAVGKILSGRNKLEWAIKTLERGEI